MQRLQGIASKISRWMNAIAAVALTFMILLTVSDVILRSFKRPIIGAYELVSLLGAFLIGFSLPFASLMKAHIKVDFFILKLPPIGRKIFDIGTKCLGIALFLIIGWNLIVLGADLHKAGEVTLTRRIPFYPIPFLIGICCFFMCLVLFSNIVEVLEKYE